MVLLVGFAAALRASEQAGLDVGDLETGPDGLMVTIRQSKTDQDGKGATIGVPRGQRRETCPVAAVDDWLQASGIESGPLLRGVTTAGTLWKPRLSRQTI